MANRDKPVSEDGAAAEPAPANAGRQSEVAARRRTAQTGAREPSGKAGNNGAIPDPLDQNRFAVWLQAQNPAWSRVVAVRAALRVLPLLLWMRRPQSANLLAALHVMSSMYLAADNSSIIDTHEFWDAVALMDAERLSLEEIEPGSVAEMVAHALTEAANTSFHSEFIVPASAARSVVAASKAVERINEDDEDDEESGPFLSEVLLDISYLRAGIDLKVVARNPLWTGRGREKPYWSSLGARDIARSSTSKFDHWTVWADWYADVLAGRQRGEAWDACFVDLDPDDPLPWDDGPKAVNERIAARLAKLKELQQQGPEPETEPKADDHPPDVPRKRPAAIEPVWRDEKLLLASEPLPADLDPDALAGALAALKDELADLADLAADYPQLDQRPPAYLRQIVDRIPGAAPTQAELFRLGHAKEVLDHFRRTVDAEWPDLLAARYHALLLQFDRTARQFPKWRAFIQNAARASLTSDQMEEVPRLVEPIAAELESPDGRAVVDPAIPQVLRNLARPIGLTEQEAEALDAGMDALAVDVLESINNILKSLVEPALGAAVGPGAAMKRYGKGFLKEADKSVERQAKQWGKEVGPALDRLLRRLKKVAVYGGSTATGGGFLLPRLYQVFPEQFGWLEPVLRFLRLI